MGTVGPMHSLKVIMRTESHESLQKTTDWHFGDWSSELEAREKSTDNPRSAAKCWAAIRFEYTEKQQLGLA